MISTVARHLGIINGTSSNWIAEVREQIEQGCNFLLVLPDNRSAIDDFCKVFEMAPDCNPTPMPRYAIFSMSQYIDSHGFDELLHALNDGKRVYFIDQLDLELNKPPRVKDYLVYCPVWGIISQHEELRPARESLDDYSFTFYRFRRNPEASIYRWIDDKWHMLELP